MVQIVLTGGCPCSFGVDPGVNPSVRTMIVEVDASTGEPVNPQGLGNMAGTAFRCDSSVDNVIDWYLGPEDSVSPTGTATNTPDTLPIVITP